MFNLLSENGGGNSGHITYVNRIAASCLRLTVCRNRSRGPRHHGCVGLRQDDRGAGGVISCSALRRAHRRAIIGERPDVRLVYLRGNRDAIAARLAAAVIQKES
jgi:hypothetical protein